MASQLTMWIPYLTAAGLAVGMAVTALLARRERWRWVVTEIVEKTAAEGPYRGWRAQERVHRAHIPAAVLAARGPRRRWKPVRTLPAPRSARQ